MSISLLDSSVGSVVHYGNSSEILLIVFSVLSLSSALVLFLLDRYPQSSIFIKNIASIISGTFNNILKSILKNIFGIQGNQADSIAGFLYDKRQGIIYYDINAVQRKLGYCRLYDEAAAPSGMIIDCEPVYFTYGGKRWLIEFWKGQYGVATGCEIGIYTTSRPDLNIPGIFSGAFYDCADDADMLYISCSLIKNGKVLFSRSDMHWWLTGFKPGEFSQTSELKLNVTMVLKDREMLAAFLKGITEAGYSKNEIAVNGNTVRFVFSSPRTRQPSSRIKQLEERMQTKNRDLCKRFNNLAKKYKDLPERFEFLRIHSPVYFSNVIDLSGSSKLSEKYKILTDHLV